MTARQLDHLRDFGLRHLERINAADAHAVAVDMQHDLNRLFARLGEEALQHVHDEFHRRVVVVEQQNLVERRLLGLGARLGDNAGTDAAAVPIVAVVSIAGTAARGAGRLPIRMPRTTASFVIRGVIQ